MWAYNNLWLSVNFFFFQIFSYVWVSDNTIIIIILFHYSKIEEMQFIN